MNLISLYNSIENYIYHSLLIIRNKRRKEKSVVLRIFLSYLVIKISQLFTIINSKKINHWSFNGQMFHFSEFDQFVHALEHRYLEDDYFVSLPKKPLIIDCGANFGDSVLYFKSLYPQAKIIAFEPDLESFNKLQKNIKGNHLNDVRVERKALAKIKSRAKFHIDPIRPGIGIMSLLSSRTQSKHFAMVNAVPLSNYIKTKVDLLKIDVEGTETEILSDLNVSKKIRFIDNLIVEYHHNIPHHKNSLKEILEIFDQNKFNYEFSTELRPPFIENIYQDILIYAYK